MNPIALLAAFALAAASPATTGVNDDLNRVYSTLQQARAANAAAGMIAAFDDHALVLDERSPRAADHAQLARQLGAVAGRLAKDGATIASGYRIGQRTVDGDVAVDSGLMRLAMAIPGQPPRIMYRRFLVTMHRKDGVWRILSDASSATDEAAWTAAVPVEGLQFDR